MARGHPAGGPADPDRRPVGLMTFKATDPDTPYPQYAANLGIQSGTGGG
jgi:hypothetical protein